MSGYNSFKNDFQEAFSQLKPVIGIRFMGDGAEEKDLARGRTLTHWLDLLQLLAPELDSAAIRNGAVPPCLERGRPLGLSVHLLYNMRVDFEDLDPDRVRKLAEKYGSLHWEDDEVLDSLSILRSQVRKLLPLCEELPGLHRHLAAVDASIDHERLVIQDEEATDEIRAAREAFEERWVQHKGDFTYLSDRDLFAATTH